MSGFSWESATILLGGVATLAIYSFLWRENAFFRFFEHLFIGIAAGFGPIFAVKNFLWPRVLEPLFGLTVVHYPDGTTSAPYNPYLLLYIVPMIFGLLYYFIYSKRFGWLAKLVIGFSLGASAGLAFKGFFNEMMPQLQSSFKPLLVFHGPEFLWVESVNNIIFVFTLIAVLYYFFFSFPRKTASQERLASSGRWLMMICFGAFFGSTVMARMALLVERLQFLIQDWYQELAALIS